MDKENVEYEYIEALFTSKKNYTGKLQPKKEKRKRMKDTLHWVVVIIVKQTLSTRNFATLVMFEI